MLQPDLHTYAKLLRRIDQSYRALTRSRQHLKRSSPLVSEDRLDAIKSPSQHTQTGD